MIPWTQTPSQTFHTVWHRREAIQNYGQKFLRKKGGVKSQILNNSVELSKRSDFTHAVLSAKRQYFITDQNALVLLNS